MTPKKVLLVVSDQGFHWDELADVYHVFNDAHWQIDIASPLGHPKAEPLTLRHNIVLHWLGRGTTRSRLPKTAWWGRQVVEKLMRARRLDMIRPELYDALYVAGGLGDLEDIEGDVVLAGILAYALKNDLLIGGRERILGSYNLLREALGTERLVSIRRPQQARAAAWRLVEAAVYPEDLHGVVRVGEFLDKKSASSYRPGKHWD